MARKIMVVGGDGATSDQRSACAVGGSLPPSEDLISGAVRGLIGVYALQNTAKSILKTLSPDNAEKKFIILIFFRFD